MRPDGGDDSLPAGPSDFDELHLWAEHVTDRCIKQGMGMSSCRNLTLYVTAKWAGLGGMAVGLLYAKEAWETSSDAASDSTLDIRFISFPEKDTVCQGDCVFKHFETTEIQIDQTTKHVRARPFTTVPVKHMHSDINDAYNRIS